MPAPAFRREIILTPFVALLHAERCCFPAWRRCGGEVHVHQGEMSSNEQEEKTTDNETNCEATMLEVNLNVCAVVCMYNTSTAINAPEPSCEASQRYKMLASSFSPAKLLCCVYVLKAESGPKVRNVSKPSSFTVKPGYNILLFLSHRSD